MAAGPARKRSFRRRRRTGRSTAAWRPRRCWRTCWSANTATTCRCIARPRSSPARAWSLDRSTLCDWVGRACWWLAPLHELMLSTVLASPKMFADDTTLPVLDPGRGRTKTGRLWCYAVDNRPWCGPGHPAAAYIYSEDRKGVHPQRICRVPRPAAGRWLCRVRPAGQRQRRRCPAARLLLGHVRRKFYDIHVANKSPMAEEALQRIAALYDIEAGVRGTPAENRRRGDSSKAGRSSRPCTSG